ncbi:MAG: 50S ribosomal protein L10, partial [Fusobacterium sp.]
KRAQSIVLVDYEGIKVKEETQLRKALREAGGEYLVAKNRLFKIALKEAGVEDSFDDILEGTTSFAFGYDDVVAPAKVMNEVSKANAKAKIFNIKGGYLTGKRVSEAEVVALASLPSREQLLSMVLNGMLGPVRKLAYGLVAVADKKEGSAE